MRGLRPSLGVVLAVSVLSLLLLTAGATTAGYLVEAHNQHADLDHRLAAAAAYVEHGLTQAETTRWQQALTRKLAALRLGAALSIVSATTKRPLYQSSELNATTSATLRSTRGPSATTQSIPSTARAKPGSASASRAARATGQPTATDVFPLGSRPGPALVLDLYARSLDQNRRLLVAFAFGLAALLAGATLLIWAAGHWLVSPLRRLNTQVDAIAGGDPIQTRVTSLIREVDNIAAAVHGMAARLTRTAEQEARLEAQRRLLISSIAHDLRTPLFSLRGYLDAISAGIGNPGERIDQARSKAQQIDRLVTGLFDYARADIDQRPSLQTTDLADAVTDVTTALEFAANEREVKLQVTPHARPSVRIDRDGFERALANVIDNALRHSPRAGTVEVACGEDADGAFVRVVDDGPGIAPDLLPHVFEPTVRADNGRRSDRAGLGLTIAARLLNNQGATIDAANAPGRGAILTLRLPRTLANSRPAEQPSRAT